MNSDPSTFTHLRDNAFHVLGVTPEATRAEVEREGQKLLAQLQLGLAEAAHYATPLGPQPRDPHAVRAALATLREPRTRLQHALWARLPVGTPSTPPPSSSWPDALARMGLAPGAPVPDAETRPPAAPGTPLIEILPPLLGLLCLGLTFYPFSWARPPWVIDMKGHAAAWPVFVLFLALPQVLLWGVTLPLGWPRLTRWLSAFALDKPDQQLALSAWALLHAPTADPQRYVQDALARRAAEPLNGTHLATHGLLAAARGEQDSARELLRGVWFWASEPPGTFELPRRIPGGATLSARRAALEWSLADAAARGEWRVILTQTRRGGAAPLLCAFFGLVASRRLGTRPVSRARLAVAWALTRRWWATWPLLQLAWKEPATQQLPAPAPEEPLAHALRRHADLAHVDRKSVV